MLSFLISCAANHVPSRGRVLNGERQKTNFSTMLSLLISCPADPRPSPQRWGTEDERLYHIELVHLVGMQFELFRRMWLLLLRTSWA